MSEWQQIMAALLGYLFIGVATAAFIEAENPIEVLLILMFWPVFWFVWAAINAGRVARSILK